MSATFAIPDPTCPQIDKVRTILVSMRTEGNAEAVTVILDSLEQLRFDNANLRMGVMHYCALYEDAIRGQRKMEMECVQLLGAAPARKKNEEQKRAQMQEALELIREKAAAMPNGGAWAAGMAALCLGTL